MNTYRCPKCGKTVFRDSKKKWIRSYCDDTGKMTRLINFQPQNLKS